MTQILTTERQQFEEYFNDFYGCHPTDHHDPIHVEGIWHAWQDGNTRAANREAQPLGYIDPGNLKTYRGVMAGGSWSPVKRTLSGLNLTLPIYLSAPPAPAVPDDLIMQVRRLVHALKKSNPDHALVKQVPDYMRRAGYWKMADCLRDGDSCRAAMLAQPVNQGYKLVPVEVLATASTLIDLCRTYTILQDTGSYKERTINDCENTMEVIDGLLAAAPEGGN